MYEEVPGISSLIRDIDGVKDVIEIGNKIKIYISGDGDDKITRKKICEAINRSGGSIIEMRLGRASIEDLFLKAIEKTT